MISENIDEDLKKAMRQQNQELISVLRMLKSALKNAEIDLKKQLDDGEVIKILRKEVKSRKDAASEFEKVGRAELVAKELSEVKIIENYLPPLASQEEIEKIVSTKISQTGASLVSDMSKVISAVMAEIGNRAEGSRVAQTVRSKLQCEQSNS